jgi:hypothetical protein
MNALQLIATDPSITGSVDKRLGIVALKLACWAPTLAEALLAPVPTIEIGGLVEWQPRTFARNKAGDVGGYDVMVTLEGHPSPDDASEEYFEIEGSTHDDPIESHWNFDVLLEVYGGGKKPDPQTGKMVWPRTLSVDGQTGRNRMFGTESWANPQLIWTRNFVSPVLPASIVQNLGTIFKTPPGNPTKLQNPPGIDGNREWLCVRVRGRQRGNIWQLADSFQLSNPDGIVPEMYPRR